MSLTLTNSEKWMEIYYSPVRRASETRLQLSEILHPTI